MIKLVVILGPTATGKSDLAVRLAKENNGEIISADSRQIYKGLDIGTGKITVEEMQGIPHHLLDIADPKERFTVEQWRKMAEEKINDISSREKLPIICGGTGFYISSVVDGITFPEVPSDPAEQKRLEDLSLDELNNTLEELDPDRALTVDRLNKRRVARAIIIAKALGKVPSLIKDDSKYDTIKIGLIAPDDVLQKRIKDRLVKRIENGMIEEAIKLHKNDLSLERMRELGLEYRYEADYIEGKLTKEQLIETLSTKIWQYARRQKTWFKRDKSIKWYDLTQTPVNAIILRR